MEFKILGPLQVVDDAGRQLRLGGRKPRAVLAMLLLDADEVVSSDRLVEELWAGEPPPTAAKSLQVHVSRLRRALRDGGVDRLQTLAGGYLLQVEPGELDAMRFQRLVEEGNDLSATGDHELALAAFDAAFELWHGHPLADFEYDSFAQADIARLSELHVAAVEQRIAGELALGRDGRAIAQLEQFVREHPYRERLRAQLMLALYRTGRQADALEAYREAREALVEELGIEPSTELRELHEAIFNQDPSLMPPGATRSGRVGKATMLFCDIDGSADLARTLGLEWSAVVDDHRRLLEAAVSGRGGRVELATCDSLLAVFGDPVAAVQASIDGQRSLAAHSWPEGVSQVRVRMGLHTGRVDRGEEGPSGLDVHLAERVGEAANGGQIVITESTHSAVAERFRAADLGLHRLKDFPSPERLFQVIVDGRGPSAFGPIRTETVRPTNLPVELRGLVGREPELVELRSLLATAAGRPVTILGFGGTGKTRLALALAGRMLEVYEGGVWLVPLAGVREPRGLLPAIATALGVVDAGERSLEEQVIERLQARPTLLVLDNFEQLVDGAHGLADLAAGSPSSRVLLTSQLPLRVEAELVYRLEPLSVEDGGRLFDERAAAALPGFDAASQRGAIERVVSRLDGMPLAIELAAARVAVMDVADILARLDRSLSLLTRGERDRPERQRSLRAALQWTYDLLSPQERTLFARLGAFAGPARLGAVDEVAGAPPGAPAIDAADALMGVIDASLVRRSEDRRHGVRFAMAQVVRDFAREQLAASGEEVAIRAAHANHLASLGEACRHWYPGYSDEARARVSALDEELRPALAWTREHDPGLHLRVASAFSGRMTRGGRLRECAAELAIALDRTDAPSATAGWAAATQSFNLIMLHKPEEARAMAGRAVSELRTAGDDDALAVGLRVTSISREALGDLEAVVAESGEALDIARRLGDPNRLGADLCFHAQALGLARRPSEALELLDEADVLRGVSDSSLEGIIVNVRGDCAAELGDWALAARCYAASAGIAERFQDDPQMVWDVQGAINALARLGHHEAVLELEGIHNVLAHDCGSDASPNAGWRGQFEAALATARASVGDSASVIIARGRAVPAVERGTRIAEVVDQATVGERATR